MERWRQIRSSRRIAFGERSAESAGASHHVVDAAAGATIYRGNAYPSEYYGNAFVSDAQNNLVHRMWTSRPSGVTFKAERADAEDRVRPVVRQLVPACEPAQRPRWHAPPARHEPRGHRGDSHPARRRQAPRPSSRPRPGADLPDRPAQLHAPEPTAAWARRRRPNWSRPSNTKAAGGATPRTG